MKYSLLIEWSERDQAYVVLLPEWHGLVAQPVADGKTYSEAAQRGEWAVETLIQAMQEDGKALPQPKVFAV
jgi:predicted RNase H-like HicB family nuclease